jgi:hypothetical protein
MTLDKSIFFIRSCSCVCTHDIGLEHSRATGFTGLMTEKSLVCMDWFQISQFLLAESVISIAVRALEG